MSTSFVSRATSLAINAVTSSEIDRSDSFIIPLVYSLSTGRAGSRGSVWLAAGARDRGPAGCSRAGSRGPVRLAAGLATATRPVARGRARVALYGSLRDSRPWPDRIAPG